MPLSKQILHISNRPERSLQKASTSILPSPHWPGKRALRSKVKRRVQGIIWAQHTYLPAAIAVRKSPTIIIDNRPDHHRHQVSYRLQSCNALHGPLQKRIGINAYGMEEEEEIAPSCKQIQLQAPSFKLQANTKYTLWLCDWLLAYSLWLTAFFLTNSPSSVHSPQNQRPLR